MEQTSTDAAETAALKKRTWHYVQPPRAFEMAACACGNDDTQWSEFDKHLWCQKCEKDFMPAHAGVLDGPIPLKAAAMLGLNFDRFNLESGKLEILDVETASYIAAP